MSLQALIFDVDGTLAETEEVHRAAFNEAFAQAGLDWHWDRALYGRLLKVAGGKERMAAVFESRGQTIGPEERALIAELHRKKTDHYTRAVSAGGVTLRPGVAELVSAAAASGLRLAIATTTSLPNVVSLLDATLGPTGRRWFSVIAAGDVVARKKPCPDIYEMALDGLGLAPHECLALEDSRNGLDAALGADVPTLVTVGMYTAHETFPGALGVLPDLTALLADRPTGPDRIDGRALLARVEALHAAARA